MAQKKINGYTILMKEILGKGSYGSVYRGEQDGTKKVCAVKVLQKMLIDQDEYLKSALFSEIQILQLLKSENVVQVLDVMESTNNYYIVQQICDSDLEKYLAHHQKEGIKISQSDATSLLKQICNGFIALVKEGIVHRDLKPANILLKNGIVKIGDFGFAKKNITKRMKNATSVGTPLYMPLQILKSQPYTSKCDIWAIGFLFYELLHLRTPWTAHSEYELIKNIEKKALIISPTLKPETKDFLTKSLQKYQKDRLSWDEVFNHPIFEGYFHKYAQQNKSFENKLKMVMTELRFQVNSCNIDLNRLLTNLGLKGCQQLNFQQFSLFIKHIQPNITKDQVNFFFEAMDSNDDGSISVQELSNSMEKNHINFNKGSNNENENESKLSGSQNIQEENKLSQGLENKVKKCFLKLFKILSMKKLTLYQTFSAYDLDKSGKLTIEEFQKIMKRLDETFSNDEIAGVFQFIDVDHSKTIEFDELSSYYCKVNGIPKSLEIPPDYHSKKTNGS